MPNVVARRLKARASCHPNRAMRGAASPPIIAAERMTTDVTADAASGTPEPVEGDPPPPTARRSISRTRLFWVDALIAVTTVLAVVGIFSVWANRLLFNPDNWENTSTQLLQNSAIRTTASNYIVDQVYSNVNVPALLRSGLPHQLQALAGPAAGALENVAVQGVELALSRPLVQTLWARANRAAIQAFIAIANGGKGAAKVKNGVVTLDLASIVDNIATRLGLPAGIAAKLPPSIAHVTVLKSNQLKFIQNGGNAIRGLALWLTIAVPLLYALAIVLARGHRRRTLMTVGFAILVAGVLGFAGRSILHSQITNSLVSDASVRPAVSAAVLIGTGILAQISGAFLLVGSVIIVAAWFAGPTRIVVPVRRAIAPFLRERAGATFSITIAVMLLVFLWDPIPATGTPVGIVAFLLLALLGTEALRRQTAEEFPDARRGEATAAMRARLQAFRGRGERREQSTPESRAALAEQLERLVALRENGEITRAEFDAAKASLLRG